MSGASGQVLAAIHVTPEAADGGVLAKLQDGDVIRVDADQGTLEVLVAASQLAARRPSVGTADWSGTGRELFTSLREIARPASAGGGVLTGVRP
jgi:phosphogluconate dehydratase